ncbi:MAG: preprotein translocase subunit SecE [Oscillospiraceae bacterium]|nr:preprotein translocase subunit SecE [Oscillospiraceae bacterium]MDD4413476.1 preprotein translocase subunit SecE [Oscillospiraceae bacterium]
MADKKINVAESVKKNAAKSDKSQKPAKKKDPRSRPSVKKYFRDLKGEFKKIIWPSKNTILRNTAATLAMCAFVGVFVTLFDLGLSALIRLVSSINI